MIYFSELIISIFFKFKQFDMLNKFILFFDEMPKLFRDLKNIFMMINHSPEVLLNEVKVNVLGLSGDFNSAVDLSLEHGIENLAIKWASKPKKESIKKKLWKKIALDMKKKDNKKVQDLLNLENCPIKIEDIMGDFDEDADIEDYKQLIQDSLSNYYKELNNCKQELEDCKEAAKASRKELEKLERNYFILDMDKKCSICNNSVFSDHFYFFNCTHSFHRHCLDRKYEQFNFDQKILKINMIKFQLNDIISKNLPSYTTSKLPSEISITLPKSMKFVFDQQNLSLLLNNLNENKKKIFEEIWTKLDNEYSQECLFCGNMIIDWAFKPFQLDNELFKI
jgi:hypothetical protein